MQQYESLLQSLRNDLRQGHAQAGNRQSPFVRRLAARYARDLPMRREAVIDACGDLMRSKDTWQQMIACAWLNRALPLLKDDFPLFERWLQEYVFSWGTCDDFCKRVLNPMFEADLGLFPRILGWTRAGGKWVRRASAVVCIKSGGGGYVVEIPMGHVFQIAGRLMADSDRHVQKGLGWMLKAASIHHRQEVYDYVKANRDRMPRTAFRYAMEKMPEHLRLEAMAD